MTTKTAAYERKKDAATSRSRRQVLLSQDIAPLPPIADQARRARADKDFRFFCEEYWPHLFSFAWSPDHLRAISKIELAVHQSATFAIGMPRGSGKTTLSMIAVVWAIVTGRHSFVFLIGAADDAAASILKNIKILLSTNVELYGDYPEAIHPIRKLEGESRRCNGQRYYGQLTGIQWMEDRIVLATIPGAACSSAIIKVSGIQGHIRGSLYAKPDGTLVRPTLVLIDDPQTKGSARSPSQCAERLSLIKGDVQGMAGPGEGLGIIMPCTVIREGDVADTLLNTTKNPSWNGERTKMVYVFPTNTDLWDEYSDVRRTQGVPASNEFYVKHREAMDAGSEVAWPERFLANELSAIQSAMNIRIERGDREFFAEYQNEPLPDLDNSASALTSDIILRKLNNHKRGVPPTGSIHLTAFIDVQDAYLWWMVVAWEQHFTGAILDYGTEPDQRVGYYTRTNAKKTLAQAAPGAGFEGAIYAGLERLSDAIIGKEWKRDDGSVMRVGKALIDIGWDKSSSTVLRFCRQSKYAPVLMPSRGRGINAAGSPMAEWIRRPGERRGDNWLERPSDTGKGRQVTFDTNHWKTFVAARVSAAMGDPGSITLYGNQAAAHQLLVDHLTAESPIPTSGRGRVVDQWVALPNRDNEGFDALVGNAVAASMLGVTVKGGEQGHTKRKSLRELYDAAKGRR